MKVTREPALRAGETRTLFEGEPEPRVILQGDDKDDFRLKFEFIGRPSVDALGTTYNYAVELCSKDIYHLLKRLMFKAFT